MEETRPPPAFISYSHDSVEHQQRALGLADRLRAGGVDAEIDQYNVAGDEAPGQGLGVVWEARIIRQLLYDAGAVSARFIPVLFSGGASAHIPTPVKGGTWYVVEYRDRWHRGQRNEPPARDARERRCCRGARRSAMRIAKLRPSSGIGPHQRHAADDVEPRESGAAPGSGAAPCVHSVIVRTHYNAERVASSVVDLSMSGDGCERYGV